MESSGGQPGPSATPQHYLASPCYFLRPSLTPGRKAGCSKRLSCAFESPPPKRNTGDFIDAEDALAAAGKEQHPPEGAGAMITPRKVLGVTSPGAWRKTPRKVAERAQLPMSPLRQASRGPVSAVPLDAALATPFGHAADACRDGKLTGFVARSAASDAAPLGCAAGAGLGTLERQASLKRRLSAVDAASESSMVPVSVTNGTGAAPRPAPLLPRPDEALSPQGPVAERGRGAHDVDDNTEGRAIKRKASRSKKYQDFEVTLMDDDSAHDRSLASPPFTGRLTSGRKRAKPRNSAPKQEARATLRTVTGEAEDLPIVSSVSQQVGPPADGADVPYLLYSAEGSAGRPIDAGYGVVVERYPCVVVPASRHRVKVQMGKSDTASADGYKWRKYGKKDKCKMFTAFNIPPDIWPADKQYLCHYYGCASCGENGKCAQKHVIVEPAPEGEDASWTRLVAIKYIKPHICAHICAKRVDAPRA